MYWNDRSSTKRELSARPRACRSSGHDEEPQLANAAAAWKNNSRTRALVRIRHPPFLATEPRVRRDAAEEEVRAAGRCDRRGRHQATSPPPPAPTDWRVPWRVAPPPAAPARAPRRARRTTSSG